MHLWSKLPVSYESFSFFFGGEGDVKLSLHYLFLFFFFSKMTPELGLGVFEVAKEDGSPWQTH